MSLRDFRIGWRLLAQQPAYSAVVIASLALGYAACFLLLGFVDYAFSYERDVPAAERIYLVKDRINVIGRPYWSELSSYPLLEVAQRSGLSDGATLMVPLATSMQAGAQLRNVELMAVNASFPALFGIRALRGDLAAALARPDALALTVATAQQLFGSDDVLGKTLQVEGLPYTVTALLANPPANSTITYAALAGIGTAAFAPDLRAALLASWGNTASRLYVRLKPGVTAQALQQVLQDGVDRSPIMRQIPPEMRDKLGDKKVIEIAVGALPGRYFDDDTANGFGAGPHGSRAAMLGLAAIAVLVLLLAVTNYVNLATVRTLQRQREIAVRKMMGAGAVRLVGQLLAESLLVALLATVLGLLLAWLLLPAFSTLVDRQLAGIARPAALLCALAIGVLVGLAAGAYPAWVALGVRPVAAMAGRGASETAGGLWLRRALTVLQFASAMGLIAATLAVAWQTRFATQASPGFDPRPLLVLDLPTTLTQDPAGLTLRDALARLPGVRGVAGAQDPVGRAFSGASGPVQRVGGKQSFVLVRNVTPNFFELYGVAPLAGRLFQARLDAEQNDNVVVLNAAAARGLGFASPQAAVGQLLTYERPTGWVTVRVVGIAPEIRHDTLRDAPQPILYRNNRDLSVLTVRAEDGADMAALAQSAGVLARQAYPGRVTAIAPAGSFFAANYADDVRLAQMLGGASVVALVIAAFGIYVLSAYNVQRRAREIVLRKLYGASRAAVARLVGAEFVLLIACGAVLGLPPAALAIRHYLATYVERAPIAGWTLLAALLLAMGVALLATLRHTLAAMRITPAHALRG